MDMPANTTPPPRTAETHSLPQSESITMKQEAQDSAATTTTTADQSIQKSQRNTVLSQSGEQRQQPSLSGTPSVPVSELRNLSAVLSSFQTHLKDLQQQFDTLQTAVDSLINKIPPQENSSVILSPLQNSLQQSTPVVNTVSAPIEEKIKEKPTECEDNRANDSTAELRTLCQTMNGKGLKKYLVTNLKEINKLKEEVPKALKQAPNPAKLVLECTGRFYLQGSKAYTNKDSPMVSGREVSVLVLECFMLMRGVGNGVVSIDKEVKEEADRAAMLWKKRMMNEGGPARACEIDARGLLLLVSCYGLFPKFKNEELRDLLRASNAREMSSALRKSSVLTEKVPEIIELMIKNKMEVDAVDLAYTFGVEKFNAETVLTPFLRKTQEAAKKVKKTAQSSPSAINLANKKKLAAFKSVLNCLEGHKLDPSKVLPGFKLSEKILTLEKVTSEFDKENGEVTNQKRRASEAEHTKNFRQREMKRSRYISQGLQKHLAIGHVENHRHLIDGSIPGHIGSYSSMYAPAAGTGHYAGVYGGMVVDTAGHIPNHSVQSHGWHGEPTLTERVIAHSYNQPSSSYGPSPSLEGYGMVPSASSVGVTSRSASDLYQFADVVVSNDYQPSAIQSHHTSYLQ